MTHNPTPWRIEGSYLVDASGKPVMGDAGEYDQMADMTQAPRILKAVNAHDDLIAVKKAAAKFVDLHQTLWTDEMFKAFGELESALARAQGENQ